LVSLGPCMAREAEILTDPFRGQAFAGQEEVFEFGNEKTLEKRGGSAARSDEASKQKPQY
jgi:hypothetical protein